MAVAVGFGGLLKFQSDYRIVYPGSWYIREVLKHEYIYKGDKGVLC